MNKQFIAYLLYFTLSISLTYSSVNEYTPVGNIKEYEKSKQDVTFSCENGKVRISVVSNNTVRVQMTMRDAFPEDNLHLNDYGPYGIVNYNHSGGKLIMSEVFDSQQEGGVFLIELDEIDIKITKYPFKLYFYDKSKNLLVKEKKGLGYKDSRVQSSMDMPDDEHFFGLGGRKNPLDLRGTSTQMYSTELGEENEGGGFPVPWFMSSKGYGIYFNNLDDDVVVDLGTKKEEYSFSGTDGNKEGWYMDYYFIYGPSFSRILESYIKLVGNPMLPEKWVFGHIQSRCCDWSQRDIVEGAKIFRDLDIPLDVMVIDFQGMEGIYVNKPELIKAQKIHDTTPVKWDPTLFDRPEVMFKQLDELSIKTCISTALFRSIYDWTKYDPTDKKSAYHYWDKIAPFVKDGIDMMWQDNAEVFRKYSGSDLFQNGYKNHQLFGTLWAKNMTDGFNSVGLYGRPVITRSGAIGAHRYALPWPGDLYHGIKYLSTDLDFMRNGGISGFTNITVDLGGFFLGDDPFEINNLTRRVFNIIPFVPVSRSHGAQGGALMPDLMKKEMQNMYRSALKFRYRLHPYIYSAAIKGHLTGRPILAPLVFDYQNDTVTFSKDYEFIFGEEFLVAPVMEKDKQDWNVYFPEGRWIHFWSGKKYEGKQTVNIPAPMLEKSGLPLFVKEGAIIPMMPEMNYIYEKSPENITLNIYPADHSSYTLYDKKSASPQDPIINTVIQCRKSEGEIVVDIHNPQSTYELCLHTNEIPKTIFYNGRKIKPVKIKPVYNNQTEGWYFGKGIFYGSEDINTLNIKLPKSKNNIQVVIHY